MINFKHTATENYYSVVFGVHWCIMLHILYIPIVIELSSLNKSYQKYHKNAASKLWTWERKDFLRCKVEENEHILCIPLK